MDISSLISSNDVQEILISVSYTSITPAIDFTLTIPTARIKASSQTHNYVIGGYYIDAGANAAARLTVGQTAIRYESFKLNGNSISGAVTVYYR